MMTIRDKRLVELKTLFEKDPNKLLTTYDIMKITNGTRTTTRILLKLLSELNIIEIIPTPTAGRTFIWNYTHKLLCRCNEVKKE